jgi:para-nitrobenzyl esterase
MNRCHIQPRAWSARAWALCGALAWAHSGLAQASGEPIVHTAQGDIQGAQIAGVTQFRGIPYAKPPVGALRWVAPQAPESWAGVRDGSHFGPACPQAPEVIADNGPHSEDCLLLNVYVPPGAQDKPRPVILWVHGSGTVLGSGSYFDASKLAQATDAVVVTFNYRLGALGWLWTSGMQAERKGANFALQDQQAAMRWVQRHIAAFQGDAQRVTLAGQSIGANSVSVHLASPKAAGLFQRAFVASGVEPPGLATPARVAQTGDGFAVKLGCPAGAEQMACLRGRSVDDILRVSPTYADIARIGVPWQNFVDGELITQDVFKAVSKGQFNRVPIMVGSTTEEGRGFIPVSYELDGTAMTEAEYKQAISGFVGASLQPLMTGLLYPTSKYGAPNLAASQVLTDVFACQANELAQRAADQVPVFMYEFADRQAPAFYVDPFLDQGAFHASDLLYWFQTPTGGAPIALSPKQLRLSQQMQRYLKRFAHTGDPGSGLSSTDADVAWPRFNAGRKPVLTLLPDASAVSDGGVFQKAHQCGTWSFFIALRLMGLA